MDYSQYQASRENPGYILLSQVTGKGAEPGYGVPSHYKYINAPALYILIEGIGYQYRL